MKFIKNLRFYIIYGEDRPFFFPSPPLRLAFQGFIHMTVVCFSLSLFLF